MISLSIPNLGGGQMKILVAGGTGFIGKPLLAQLNQEGYEIVLLTRNKSSVPPSLQKIAAAESWDAKSPAPWEKEMDDAEAVINLVGEPIANKRWSASQKEKLVKSRIEAARALIHAMQNAPRKPKVFINASAVGYYGNVAEGELTEDCPKGEGFLADTCGEWEGEAQKARELGVRTVLLRIGIVLDQRGGALAKMLFPFQCFMGGPLGSGKQWVSWIYIQDVIGIILFALKNESLSGPVNAVSPAPVRMKEFCAELGKAIHRPSWIPVPAFILKILLGEMSEMLLGGQKVIPQKLLNSGYPFGFSKLDQAFQAALK